MDELELQRLVFALPTPVMALRPDRDFTIVAASEQYLRVARKDASIFGRPLFEAFTDNPNLVGADGTRNLGASLRRVIATRAPDTMPIQRYDLAPLPGQRDEWEERYWSPVNAPVLGA